MNVDAASKDFWCSFNSGGNGNGYVDGSVNGVYYTLNAGTAYMKVTYFHKTGAGTYAKIILKRQQFGFDANYGTKSVNSTGTYSWSVDTYSDKYYLYAYGDQIYTDYTIQGTIYN